MKTKLLALAGIILALAGIILLPLVASAAPGTPRTLANAIESTPPMVSKSELTIQLLCPPGRAVQTMLFSHKDGENLTSQESFGFHCAQNTSTYKNGASIVTDQCSWNSMKSKAMLVSGSDPQADSVVTGIRFAHKKDENLTYQESFAVLTCKLVNGRTVNNSGRPKTTKQSPQSYVGCDFGLMTDIMFLHDKDKNGTHEESVEVGCYLDPGNQIADSIYAAYNGWLGRTRIANASLAVMQNGNFIGKFGFGARQSDTPVQIASLTKAITAMCIASLVDANKIQYTTPASTILKDFFTSPQTKIADPLNANNITVEHLLRHTSGFPGAQSAAAAKNPAFPWLGVVTDPVAVQYPWAAGVTWTTDTESAAEAFARLQLAQSLTGKPGAVPYDYNNVNYALLGMIIKKVTNQTYEDYCKQAAISPFLTPGMRVLNAPSLGIKPLGAFGGWAMSAESYAVFIDTHFRQKMSAKADAFMKASYANGYGLGVGTASTQNSKGTRNLNHTGNWKTPISFSSYFALWFGLAKLANSDVVVVTTQDTALRDTGPQNQFFSKDNTSIDCTLLTATEQTC